MIFFNNYWWLLYYKLLLDIIGYIIISYWWLFYCKLFEIIFHKLSLVILNYFTLGPNILF
jgi:hypothetical protein